MTTAQLAQPEQVQLLRALRGYPLTVLAAIAICQADLFTDSYLRRTIDWSQEKIDQATESLLGLTLIERVARYTYRLTPRGRAICPPLAYILTPEKMESLPTSQQPGLLPAAATPKNVESHSQRLSSSSEGLAQSAGFSDDSKKSGVGPGVVVVDESSTSLNSHTTTPERAQALAALRDLRVPQAKANQILASSPFSPGAIIAQVQAWAAYRDSGDTKLNRALLPNLAAARLLAGDLCPYDPPAPDDEKYSVPAAPEPAPDPIFDDDALHLTEAEQLWRQALANMRRDLHATTYNLIAQCALAAGDQPNTFIVLCDTRFTFDWLSNRMSAAIHRELTSAAGRPVSVNFAHP